MFSKNLKDEVDEVEEVEEVEHVKIKNNQNQNQKELIVQIGCAAGRHRSVALVDKLSKDERLRKFSKKVVHQEL